MKTRAADDFEAIAAARRKLAAGAAAPPASAGDCAEPGGCALTMICPRVGYCYRAAYTTSQTSLNYGDMG